MYGLIFIPRFRSSLEGENDHVIQISKQIFCEKLSYFWWFKHVHVIILSLLPGNLYFMGIGEKFLNHGQYGQGPYESLTFAVGAWL